VTAIASKPPLILLAPGAGAPSSSEWMRAWAERLATLGHVVPFDYPYQRAGRRRPDRLPTLVAAHREALERARAEHDGPVLLAGKSMGGRVGCHVSLEEPVAGLICFGYPLKGASGAVRDEVLRQLTCPVLFVQGSRDALFPLDLLATVTPHLKTSHTLYVVEGGDHSLQVRKKDLALLRLSQDDVDANILAAVAAFIRQNRRT